MCDEQTLERIRNLGSQMKYHKIQGYRSGTGTDGHNGGVYADSECVSEINTGQKMLAQSRDN